MGRIKWSYYVMHRALMIVYHVNQLQKRCRTQQCYAGLQQNNEPINLI